MSVNIEELRKQKEKLEKEREEVERQLQEAERRDREQKAQHLVKELREFTVRIDQLKEERQQLLTRMREAAPRLGDFTYAIDDYRLTLSGARASMKQPELFDKLHKALGEADFHLEPRTPRFRIFRGLRVAGTVQIHAKRIHLVATEPVIDYAILTEAQEIDARYPGLVTIEYATHRRVREGIPGRPADGRYATAIHFVANDTGSLDTVMPLALRALDHVASYWERVTPDEELRIFEPLEAAAPVEAKAPAAEATPKAPEAPEAAPAQAPAA